jgi:hypothetical protein
VRAPCGYDGASRNRVPSGVCPLDLSLSHLSLPASLFNRLGFYRLFSLTTSNRGPEMKKPAAVGGGSEKSRETLERFCAGKKRHCVCYCVGQARQFRWRPGTDVVCCPAPAIRRLPGVASESEFLETVATPDAYIKFSKSERRAT